MRRIIFIILVLTLGGCATDQAQEKRDAYARIYEPLMGKTEEEIVMSQGAPTEIQDAGGIRIYTYRVSHGNRLVAMRGFGPYGNTYGTSFESFDQARVYFQMGYAKKWDANWQ